MMKLQIINGPNLNLLGKREPQIYGNLSFDTYFVSLKQAFPIELSYFQSNIEGELIDCIQQSETDGIILNAGGYTHTSVALRDAISAIQIPVIEVHLSNLLTREHFRHESLIGGVCVGSIMGLGLKGYELAVRFFLETPKN